MSDPTEAALKDHLASSLVGDLCREEMRSSLGMGGMRSGARVSVTAGSPLKKTVIGVLHTLRMPGGPLPRTGSSWLTPSSDTAHCCAE